MEDNKKKVTKKINIKNKKDAAMTLSKSSIKGKTTSKTKKNSTRKIKVTNNTINNKEKPVIIVDNWVPKKVNEISTPNNIKRKIPKEEKNKKDNSKKQEKKKIKIELPKEWKLINTKNKNITKSKTKSKNLDNTQSLKNKLRSSFFEEINEHELAKQKEQQKKTLKKTLIITLIVVSVIAIVLIALIKYNDFVKKQLAIYDVYKIGDKVRLENDSIWYVVNDSDSKESTLILLSDNILDINGDDIRNEDDKLPYNSDNKAEYDEDNENSAAKYLKTTYKEQIEKEIGSIDEARLLTSKEYVKIRERMGYGYEWSEDNFLANIYLSKWWINSVQNEKVFAVTPKGSYSLVAANTVNYIRPTIIINKEKVNKVLEQRKKRADLIIGLNG